MVAKVVVEVGSVSKKRDGLFAPNNLFGYFMMLPALSVLFFFFAYPLTYEVWSSLTDATLGNDAKFIGLDNYAKLFADPEFLTAARNSVIYVSFVQAGKFILGLGIAILLHQKLVARGFWRAVVLVPYAMPGFVAFILEIDLQPRCGCFKYFLN